MSPERPAIHAEVYDMLGRIAAVLPDPDCTPSSCRLTWDGNRTIIGVSIVRIGTGKGSDTVPIVLRR